MRGQMNKNGQLLLNFVEDNDLKILNEDGRRSGKYTLSLNNLRSIVDYTLINRKAELKLRGMYIYNDSQIDSDHFPMVRKFNIKMSTNVRARSVKRWKIRDAG